MTVQAKTRPWLRAPNWSLVSCLLPVLVVSERVPLTKFRPKVGDNSLLSTERNKSNHNFRLNQKLQWVSCFFLRDEQFWSFRTKGAILRNIYIHFVWWNGDLYHKISNRGHCLQYFSMCVWHVEEFTLLEKLSLVPGGNPQLVPVSRPVPFLRY